MSSLAPLNIMMKQDSLADAKSELTHGLEGKLHNETTLIKKITMLHGKEGFAFSGWTIWVEKLANVKAKWTNAIRFGSSKNSKFILLAIAFEKI